MPIHRSTTHGEPVFAREPAHTARARGDVEPLLHDAIIGTLIVLASLADRWFFDDR